MLVAELRKDATITVRKHGRLRAADYYQRVPAAHVARARTAGTLLPEAVVAITLLEVGDVAVRVGQGTVRAGRRDQPQSHEVVPRQGFRVVDRQVGHQRHAVVLEQPVADRAFAIGMLEHQRLQQERPVRRYARRPVLADERQKLLALRRVGCREHGPIGRQPLDLVHAVQALTVVFPGRGVGAGEPVKRVFRFVQGEVLAEHLDVQQHDVDVVEEVQVDMSNGQRDRHATGAGREPHRRDVIASEHAHRRAAGVRAARRLVALRTTFAVEEPLHVRQERRELVVMAFLEVAGVASEFVRHLVPRISGSRLLEQFPVPLDLRPLTANRHQLQRPEHDLPELPYEFLGCGLLHGHD